MAQNSDLVESDSKLQPTIDDIQKRFFCDSNELVVWRNSLLLRYLAITDTLVETQIKDLDKNGTPLPLSSKLLPVPPPPSLDKTVIRVLCGKAKSVTITLYFTNSGGTLLCQGRDCITWDKEECEVIKTFVSTFLQDWDRGALSHSLLHHPLKFIEKIPM